MYYDTAKFLVYTFNQCLMKEIRVILVRLKYSQTAGETS